MNHLVRIAAIAALASSLLASGEALADDRGRGHARDRGDRPQAAREWRGDRGDPGDRGDRGHQGPRRGGRWDDGPPDAYVVPGPPGYARRPPPPGYGLRRGGLVPPEYRGAVVPDYGRHRLRPPPPGFAWVRMGDRYMLVSRATGQIFDMIGD